MARRHTPVDLGPAYQRYVNDWRSSRATMRMSFAERGVYTEMIDQQWLDGSLPDDPEAVADLLAITLEQRAEVLAAWEVVRRKFVEDEKRPGRIYNVKLEKLRRERLQFIRTKQTAGQRGGSQKAANRKSGDQLQGKQKASTATGVLQQTSSTPLAKPTSSSSSSSSSSCVPRAPDGAAPTRASGTGAGVMAGTLPRDHLRHAFCGRVCVPDFLHAEFTGKLTGDPHELSTAAARLREWYAATLAAIPKGRAIGDEPIRFWRAQFAAWQPSAVPSGKTDLPQRRPPSAEATLAQLDAEAAEFAR